MSDDDLKAELERLRNENAALKKEAATGVTMKVSEKGALSIYGMGRFPVTLYKEQWLKLLGMSDDIRAFIVANEGQLKTRFFIDSAVIFHWLAQNPVFQISHLSSLICHQHHERHCAVRAPSWTENTLGGQVGGPFAGRAACCG